MEPRDDAATVVRRGEVAAEILASGSASATGLCPSSLVGLDVTPVDGDLSTWVSRNLLGRSEDSPWRGCGHRDVVWSSLGSSCRNWEVRPSLSSVAVAARVVTVCALGVASVDPSAEPLVIVGM